MEKKALTGKVLFGKLYARKGIKLNNPPPHSETATLLMMLVEDEVDCGEGENWEIVLKEDNGVIRLDIIGAYPTQYKPPTTDGGLVGKMFTRFGSASTESEQATQMHIVVAGDIPWVETEHLYAVALVEDELGIRFRLSQPTLVPGFTELRADQIILNL